MNNEALASKAADAVGVTPHSDMRLFVEQAVKWALKEAALSTAEPVATVAEMGAGGMRVLMPHPPGSTDHLPIGTKLYAAPPALSAQVQDVAGWEEREREARAKALEEAALWHDARVQEYSEQIAVNDAYLARGGRLSSESRANEYCDDMRSCHRRAAAAIRALQSEER